MDPEQQHAQGDSEQPGHGEHREHLKHMVGPPSVYQWVSEIEEGEEGERQGEELLCGSDDIRRVSEDDATGGQDGSGEPGREMEGKEESEDGAGGHEKSSGEEGCETDWLRKNIGGTGVGYGGARGES